MLAGIESFVNRLGVWAPHAGVVNQYWLHGADLEIEANAIRRRNLSNYLQNMAHITPQVILVGEAPGYRGCRLTGIPFTSEYLLFESCRLTILSNSQFIVTRSDDQSSANGFTKTLETEEPIREATATMIWEVLAQLNFCPLLWNAFPFHPHRLGSKHSNRSPTKTELAFGQAFLLEILRMFDIGVVVAVGRKAEWCLRRLKLDFTYIRHPSHGGRSDFERDLRELAASL